MFVKLISDRPCVVRYASRTSYNTVLDLHVYLQSKGQNYCKRDVRGTLTGQDMCGKIRIKENNDTVYMLTPA